MTQILFILQFRLVFSLSKISHSILRFSMIWYEDLEDYQVNKHNKCHLALYYEL